MSFATAITCMDGRFQHPVLDYLEARFEVKYVDMITEPGPNRILAMDPASASTASILRRLAVSLHKHGSCGVAIVGHEDCAGNPAGRNEQMQHLAAARKLLTPHVGNVDLVSLWVNLDGSVEEVSIADSADPST